MSNKSPDTFCVSDEDECVLDASICGLNSHCNNTDGSYQCECKIGYFSENLTYTDCAGKPIVETLSRSLDVRCKVN